MELILFLTGALSVMIAPGPNNLMVMHSSYYFGSEKTKPHILGIILGVGAMLFLVSIAVGFFLDKIILMRFGISLFGSVYLIYLGLKMILINRVDLFRNKIQSPMKFSESFFFQLVNPKAWFVCVVFSGMYNFSSYYLYNALLLVSIKTLINIPCLYAWIGIGKILKKALFSEKNIHLFNTIVGILLIVSAFMLWL